LVGPPTSPATSANEPDTSSPLEPLSEPLCPHGAPQSGNDLPEPPQPGVSWYENSPLSQDGSVHPSPSSEHRTPPQDASGGAS
jgi:hypothetical protein